MSAIESDLRYLRDQSDIKDLVHRFVKAADQRSVEGMLSCVSDDVVVSFNDGELLIEGAKQLRAYMTDQFHQDGTLNPDTRGTHMMANTIVTLAADRAKAETSGITVLATPAGTVHMRGVRYDDVFARIDGEWRLISRSHACDWQVDTAGRTAPPLLR